METEAIAEILGGRKVLGKAIRKPDDLAQLVENGSLVIAVTASVDESWSAADVTVIFLRPLDDLDVSCAVLHCWDSSIAHCTASV